MKPAKISLKAFLPRTLFARSLLILITPVVLIQVITVFVFFDRHWSKMTTRLAYAVAGEVALMADIIGSQADPDVVGYLENKAQQRLELQVRYIQGGVLSGAEDFPPLFVWKLMVARTLSAELQASLRRPFTLDMGIENKRVQVSVQLEDGVLVVSLPQRRLFSSSGYIFLLWMIGTSMFLLMIAIVFMRNQIRPIKKLAVAAERFGKGRDVGMFKPQGAMEVRMAGEAFLDMYKRIRRQIEQRTLMLAGVSHDLRTPLTRLRLHMAMLGHNPDIENMKKDIHEMERMIQGYLDFVRGDGDEAEETISLNDLFEKIIFSARKQGLEIASNISGDIEVTVKPMAFERCLTNLVNNAGKYADHIWISASIDPSRKLMIIVEDDGPGIDENQYEEVFRPFYRVDSSRNADTGGVGLGLPIAMDIVHGHGGRIWLERSRYGGLKVSVKLPL